MGKAIVATKVRVLPEDVCNKIAAGEVVERPASVVKELVENALDAGATRISVRLIAAGRRVVEVIDNGSGMTEQDALLAIERHATSKINAASDLDRVQTMGFRGEALASIASVSRFELVTRRAESESATHIQIDGGSLRSVDQRGAPVGTKVSVNRLYFNTPVRAKFLKGITTELSHCIDIVQRHALSHPGVGFQLVHNDKLLLDVPPHADLRQRVALIWGLRFVEDMIDVDDERAGFHVRGVIGLPNLTRSSRSHQFFFINRRPVVSRPLQYGFEEGYARLLTIGRHPVGVLLIDTAPQHVDVNIHPTKREVRFRDDRVVRDALRDVVRVALEKNVASAKRAPVEDVAAQVPAAWRTPQPDDTDADPVDLDVEVPRGDTSAPERVEAVDARDPSHAAAAFLAQAFAQGGSNGPKTEQTELPISSPSIEPDAVYRPVHGMEPVAMQLFDTYLLVPEDDRLLIIDQHALHERLNYDTLAQELADHDYAAQQLVVPILLEISPSAAGILEENRELFSKLGMEIEPFGGSTFQVTAISHLYDESRVPDAVYKILDELAQGNLFDRDEFMADFMRFATQACKASIRAGDRLTSEEKHALVEGFRRMRPPYTCPHGRPIITELTLTQMEKSFRRRQ